MDAIGQIHAMVALALEKYPPVIIIYKAKAGSRAGLDAVEKS
jgi:hypothetical protein